MKRKRFIKIKKRKVSGRSVFSSKTHKGMQFIDMTLESEVNIIAARRDNTIRRIRPNVADLSKKWKDLTEEQRAMYKQEAERQNVEGPDFDDPDVCKQFYKNVKSLCWELCEMPEMEKTDTHLLIFACSSAGSSVVISKSPVVRAFYNKEIGGPMEMEDLIKYKNKSNDGPQQQEAINEDMTKELNF